MDIQILDAQSNDMEVVRNLVRFYIYDMAEYTGWPAPETGLYGGVDNLETYWQEEDRHPFIVRVDGELAGFSLVNQHDGRWHIGEFFIVRKFRRTGVGTHVAKSMFDRFRGDWCVMQLPPNKPAVGFWRRVIDDYTHGQFECDEHTPSAWGEMVSLTFCNNPP